MSPPAEFHAAGAVRPGQVFKFGSGAELAGCLSAAREPRRLGAVLWGMGIAEMQIARRLARNGIPTLQIRIDDGNHFKDFERRNRLYDHNGVRYCREALDQLCALTRVSQFLVMGNCATGNICFNAARADPRIVGLVMTNPHFQQIEAPMARLLTWARTREAWRRALTFEPRLLCKVGSGLSRMARRIAGLQAASATRHSKDVVLPEEFGARLGDLDARGVRTLLVYASSEAGLHYVRQTHGARLAALQARGGVAVEVLARGTHVFSGDEGAADDLNRTVSAWVVRSFPPAGTVEPNQAFAG
jgi:hypothetical protein